MPKAKLTKNLQHEIDGYERWDGVFDLGSRHERGKGFSAFFFGKSRSGKSVAMIYTLYKNRDKFYGGLLLSQVVTNLSEYRLIAPKSLVIDTRVTDYEHAIQQVLDTNRTYIGDPSWPIDNLLVVMDDISADKTATNKNVLRELATQGRHYNISTMTGKQYFMQVAPDIRQNATHMIFTRPRGADMKRIWEQLFKDSQLFKTKDDYQLVINYLTRDYQCFVWDTSSPTGAPLKVFKADITKVKPPAFKLFHRDMWLLDKLHRIRKPPVSMKDIIPSTKRAAASAHEEGRGDRAPRDIVEDANQVAVCIACLRGERRGEAKCPLHRHQVRAEKKSEHAGGKEGDMGAADTFGADDSAMLPQGMSFDVAHQAVQDLPSDMLQMSMAGFLGTP